MESGQYRAVSSRKRAADLWPGESHSLSETPIAFEAVAQTGTLGCTVLNIAPVSEFTSTASDDTFLAESYKRGKCSSPDSLDTQWAINLNSYSLTLSQKRDIE
jgi:hypothetical protein